MGDGWTYPDRFRTKIGAETAARSGFGGGGGGDAADSGGGGGGGGGSTEVVVVGPVIL